MKSSRESAKAIERRRVVGAQMANVCFNLSQRSSPLDQHMKELLADLCRQWDRIATEEQERRAVLEGNQ